MRKWLLYLLVIAFFWVLATRFADVEKLAGVLSGGNWQWILAAFLLQALYHVVYTALYQSAFYTVEVRSRFRELWPVTFASLFTNVVVPAGGVSGAALFIDDAARRGESPAKAAAGTLLVTITELGSFLVILAVGMYELFTHHSLQRFEIVGAGILIAVIAGLGLILLVGLVRPGWVAWLLERLQQAVNRVSRALAKRDLLGERWSAEMSSEFSTAAEAVRRHPDRLSLALLVSAVAHAVDLTCLYTLFLAFNQPVGLGALVAGYSMAILFWVVSPTPQGVGVVEAVVAMVYTSLGVPGTKAIVIALAFRGLAFWIPLLVGVVVIRSLRTFRTTERVHAKLFEIHVVAVAIALVGVLNIFSAVMPALTERVRLLEPLLSGATRHGARFASVLAGFGLITISRAMWRRKRVAWIVTLVLLMTSLVSHLLKGLDFEEASIVCLMILWLLKVRRHYQVPSDYPSVRQGVSVLAASLLLTLAYGTLGFYLLDRHFAIHYSLPAAFYQTATMFLELYNPGYQPITWFGRYFADSIYLAGLVSLAYSLLLILRPVFIREPAGEEEREEARRTVEAHGKSSLAQIALLNDKSYLFSPGGSVVAFTSNAGIGLALGDPIGPSEDTADTLREFRAYCAMHDWRPAFYQTLPDSLETYRKLGFNTLCIGHEATVDVRSFSLEGGAVKSIRTSVNKLVRSGYTTEIVNPPLSDALLEELRLVSDEWLTLMHGSEKRFSLGWFDDDYIRCSPVAIVRGDTGAVIAFANIISEFRRNEATVDLMRRTRGAPGGTMDFLFVRLFEWAKQSGFETFNLGLSPFAGVGEREEDPVAERAMRFVYKHLNQFYSFKGLHSFKDKFGPEWSPRYLVYDGPSALLATAYAVVNADNGGGVLRSYIGKRLKRGRNVGKRDVEPVSP